MADTPLERAKEAVDEAAAHAQEARNSATQAREEIEGVTGAEREDATGPHEEPEADREADGSAGIDVGGGGGGSGGGTTND